MPDASPEAAELRILVVNGESIRSSTPTGVTLSTVLSGFRPDQIMEICLTEGDLKGDIQSLTLPPRTLVLRHAARRFLGGARVATRVNDEIRATELSGRRAELTWRNKAREIGNALLDLGPVRVPRSHLRAVRDFAPHVVYTSGCTIAINRIAVAFARHCDVPVVTHYLDNWRHSLYPGPALALARARLARSVRDLESRSRMNLAISEQMATDYSQELGKPFLVLLNAADTPQQPLALPHRAEITLLYAGGLHLSRHVTLLQVEKSVRRLRDQGHDCRLVVHTGAESSWVEPLFDRQVTDFRPYVPHEELPAVLAGAAVLLHVESFEVEQRDFIRYSISTKIAEYLAAGRPLLCVAPLGTAVHDYVASTGAGVSAATTDELDAALKTLVLDETARHQMARRGPEVARERHSREQARRTLLRAIEVNLTADQGSSDSLRRS